MPKDPSKNAYSKGLTYVAQKPSFLANFGKPASPPRAASSGRPGREPLPERPKDGEWAEGSDGEKEEEEDEWGEVYGGGGDDGPQVVVLKEGRHLTEEEVKRERRRGEWDDDSKHTVLTIPSRRVTITSTTCSASIH
jgi:hypothetical protein